MKKIFAFAIILFVTQLSAQTAYKYKGEFGEAQQKEVLKSADSLFYYTPDVILNVSTNHIRPYSDIAGDRTLRPGYLDEQMKLLKKQPDDAVIFNNIANYYRNIGDQKNAQEYYTKALTNLKVPAKAKDSASYYSFRGLIKFNMGQEGMQDIERSLSINKSDSLSLAFYPFFLIQKNEISKAKTVVLDALNDKNNKLKEFSYLMIGIVEMYGAVVSFSGLDNEQTDKFLERDIAKIIDFDVYDKYMDPSNSQYNKAKQMIGLFNGILKYSRGLEEGSTFMPDKNDIAYMDQKEEYFKKVLKEKKANLYGAYFSLGIINYIQKKLPEALGYFEKAIAAFPKDKEGFQFNVSEIYDNMAGVYFMQKDYDKVKAALTKKIAIKSISTTDRREAYLDIAGLCLQQGDLAGAETNALAALEIEDSFGPNSLLSYISFKRNYGLSADKYLQKAMAQITTEQEVCKALTMVAAVQIHNGLPDGAYAVYNEYKPYLGASECDCEAMLGQYIEVNK